MANSASTTAAGSPEGKPSRRDFVYIATATVGAVGAVAALVPLVDQMNPDASTLAAGGPVDLDVSKIEEGAQVVVRWRERPIFVFHRSQQTLQTLQETAVDVRSFPTRIPSSCSSRPTRPIGIARSSRNSACWSASARISAASRCSIRSRTRRTPVADWLGGYFCPCHGSKYDPAGPRLQRRAGALQSAGAALPLRQRHHHPGRRKSQRFGLEFRLDLIRAALNGRRAGSVTWHEDQAATADRAGPIVAPCDCRRPGCRIRRRRISAL